jgi:hypothetical protein
MGLVAHPYDRSMKLEQGDGVLLLDGVPLAGCVTPTDGDESAFSILPEGVLYCYAAPTEVEVWVIGQRLAGHVPADEEIAAKEAEISAAESD